MKLKAKKISVVMARVISQHFFLVVMAWQLQPQDFLVV
jgi:hypothetical protein